MSIRLSIKEKMLELIRFARSHDKYSFNTSDLATIAKLGKTSMNNPAWKQPWTRLVALGIFKHAQNEKGKTFKHQFCMALPKEYIEKIMSHITGNGMDTRGQRPEGEDKPEIRHIDLGEAVKKSLELDNAKEEADPDPTTMEVYHAQRYEVIHEIAHININILKEQAKVQSLYKLLHEITAED